MVAILCLTMAGILHPARQCIIDDRLAHQYMLLVVQLDHHTLMPDHMARRRHSSSIVALSRGQHVPDFSMRQGVRGLLHCGMLPSLTVRLRPGASIRVSLAKMNSCCAAAWLLGALCSRSVAVQSCGQEDSHRDHRQRNPGIKETPGANRGH